jgi:hypothetical protein
MYVKVNNNGTITYTILTIPSTNYLGSTLVSALQTLFNTAYSGIFTITYNITLNTISISTNNGLVSFKVYTDADLATSDNGSWGGASYDTRQVNSCNDIITNRTSGLYTSTNGFTTGSINLQGFRAIYISSSNLSTFNSIGPRGEQASIIKKVLTSSDFGYNIIDQFTSDHDYLECSKLCLSNIDFQLRDCKGNVIPLHDSPVSFTLCFAIKQ